MKLYPLKFKPDYKERVWGGRRFSKNKNKNPVGEVWTLSAVEDNLSIVSNGYLKDNNIGELVEIYMGDLVGESVYDKFGIELPLLFKIIDTGDRLSLQVHPDDETSLKRHNAYGKTEMWYVMDAEPDSSIYVGFNKTVDRDEYRRHMKNKSPDKILNIENAKPGDVFFLPPGRIHAIGKGLLIAEIQQTSDITYRIYDWGREDNPNDDREIHTELAEDVIDYEFHESYKTVYKAQKNAPVELVSCKYFTTNLLRLENKIERDLSEIDSFVVYMCAKGRAEIICENGSKETIAEYETVMIPAEIPSIEIIPCNEAELLEIYVK